MVLNFTKEWPPLYLIPIFKKISNAQQTNFCSCSLPIKLPKSFLHSTNGHNVKCPLVGHFWMNFQHIEMPRVIFSEKPGKIWSQFYNKRKHKSSKLLCNISHEQNHVWANLLQAKFHNARHILSEEITVHHKVIKSRCYWRFTQSSASKLSRRMEFYKWVTTDFLWGSYLRYSSGLPKLWVACSKAHEENGRSRGRSLNTPHRWHGLRRQGPCSKASSLGGLLNRPALIWWTQFAHTGAMAGLEKPSGIRFHFSPDLGQRRVYMNGRPGQRVSGPTVRRCRSRCTWWLGRGSGAVLVTCSSGTRRPRFQIWSQWCHRSCSRNKIADSYVRNGHPGFQVTHCKQRAERHANEN